MRMTGDHDVDIFGGRPALQIVDVMQDVEDSSSEPNDRSLGIVARPVSDIDIPPDSRDRRNPA